MNASKHSTNTDNPPQTHSAKVLPSWEKETQTSHSHPDHSAKHLKAEEELGVNIPLTLYRLDIEKV